MKQTPEPELTARKPGLTRLIAEARIGALGSGSDYTPFLQHLGIPSIDMGFGGDYGVYHSAYDSFLLDEQLWRSDFQCITYWRPSLWGTVAMRLANAPGVPFNYRDYASQIRDYFNQSIKTAKSRKLESTFSEKPMMEAIEDFAQEAEKIEKARRDAIAELENARGRSQRSASASRSKAQTNQRCVNNGGEVID